MVNEIGFETHGFDFGINDETGNHFVGFQLQNGGYMSFVMNKTMTVR